MKTICVAGTGRIRRKPDLTGITLTLEDTQADYGEAIRRSSEATELLRDLVAGVGFERDALKTLDFNIDTEYEGYEENGIYKQRFVGYKYRHLMKIEFDADSDRLGKLLYAFANCPAKPEFRISYTVRDPEAAKSELLANAVANAKAKAEVLAKAAGVKLKHIRRINYGRSEINLEVVPAGRLYMAKDCCEAAGANSYALNIAPEDITATDTVTIIWEID
ncbi:MAG: SIMPL domain-containing protein [Clostridia bacterium]|nr:SIMPL domain-containing protein [Clostridia bacterium]